MRAYEALIQLGIGSHDIKAWKLRAYDRLYSLEWEPRLSFQAEEHQALQLGMRAYDELYSLEWEPIGSHSKLEWEPMTSSQAVELEREPISHWKEKPISTAWIPSCMRSSS